MVTHRIIKEKKQNNITIELSVRSDGFYSVYVEKEDIIKGISSKIEHFESPEIAFKKFDSLSTLKDINNFLRDSEVFNCYY